MRKVKLSLDGLNAVQTIAKARHLVASQTGNPAYSSPVPALSAITTAADELEAANQEAMNRDSVKIAFRNTKLDILLTLLRRNAVYVQEASASVGDTILTSGWELVSINRDPVGPLAPTAFLKVFSKPGFFGKLNLEWKSVRGCKSFVISRTTDPMNNSFEVIGVSTKTTFVDTECQAGTFYYYTITSVGPLGPGGVSDISKCMAV